MPPDDNDDPDAREAWAAYEAEREREAWAARLLALAANPCDEGDEDEE